MSDRRPSKPEVIVPCEHDKVDPHLDPDWGWKMCPGAKSDEVLAVVRSRVESGTIKGEVVEWCRVHRGNPRDCEHKAVYDESCDVTQALVVSGVREDR